MQQNLGGPASSEHQDDISRPLHPSNSDLLASFVGGPPGAVLCAGLPCFLQILGLDHFLHASSFFNLQGNLNSQPRIQYPSAWGRTLSLVGCPQTTSGLPFKAPLNQHLTPWRPPRHSGLLAGRPALTVQSSTMEPLSILVGCHRATCACFFHGHFCVLNCACLLLGLCS